MKLKIVYYIIVSLFFTSFLYASNYKGPCRENVIGEVPMDIIDIELKPYGGCFYLKAVVTDPQPEEAIYWSAVAGPVATCEICEWPYPEDVTFAEHPFLFKRIEFSYLPTQCEVTLSVGGQTITKGFTILRTGEVQEGLFSVK